MQLAFAVPGFSKCGTTSLCALLSEHPSLFIPAIKEPNFFAGCYDRGWSWYESLFSDAGDRLCGEGSTFYSSAEFGSVAVERMLQHNPSIKFIVIARHPFRRLESSFREQHHSGHRWGVTAPESLAMALHRFPNMVADTLYHECIEPFRKAVKSSRLHFLFLEDLQKDPRAVVEEVFRFLDVDPGVPLPNLGRQLNSGQSKLKDGALLRVLRRMPISRQLIMRAGPRTIDTVGQRIGLRKPVGTEIYWDRSQLAPIVEKIRIDAKAFLEFSGKPTNFWDLSPPWEGNSTATRRAA